MESEIPVRVIRSVKRKRTASARLSEGVLEVRIPARMSKAEEEKLVAKMVAKVQTKHTSRVSDDELAKRATKLNAQYLGNRAQFQQIRWAKNQLRRWGSCTTSTGSIRISARLTDVPGYVLDSVILHELAHTIEPNHSPAFYALLQDYPYQERAEGFLEAWSRMHPPAEAGPEAE